MIEDLANYKPSDSEIGEAEYCPISLLYHVFRNDEGIEMNRGADWAQLEAEWWKRLDPSVLASIPYDPFKRPEQQKIFDHFMNVVTDWDVQDTVFPLFMRNFCLYETERFAKIGKTTEAMQDYFLPVLCEYAIEGTQLIGVPDKVFRIPGTGTGGVPDHYYIEDTKTSLNPPRWRTYIGENGEELITPFEPDLTQGRRARLGAVKKKSMQYVRGYRQGHTYYIILSEHGLLLDYGQVLHLCPFLFDKFQYQFRTASVSIILNRKVPLVRNLYRIFRDNLTEADNPEQIRALGKILIKKPDPWKCDNCSRNTYCAALTEHTF